MKDEIMKGIVWMTTDGIKDADMAYEHAVGAKEAGKPELAAMFIEDAKYRLGKVKEWYEQAMSMHGGQLDAIADKHLVYIAPYICHRGDEKKKPRKTTYRITEGDTDEKSN